MVGSLDLESVGCWLLFESVFEIYFIIIIFSLLLGNWFKTVFREK